MKNQTQNTETKTDTPKTIVDNTEEIKSDSEELLPMDKAADHAETLYNQGVSAKTIKSAVVSVQRSVLVSGLKSKLGL